MDRNRRFFLRAFVSGGVVASAVSLRGLPQQGQPPPMHPEPQGPPQQPPFPPPLSPPTKAQLTENQREIKKDVDQLFALAQDLKAQAAKTDSSEVLSVAFVQKTEQIEKLARKIRSLIRL